MGFLDRAGLPGAAGLDGGVHPRGGRTLDLLFPHGGTPYDIGNKASRAILKPLQEQVRTQGLWACHLGPELASPASSYTTGALIRVDGGLF